jgi:hypothetical protein
MTRHCGWTLSMVVVLLWSVLASASDGQAGDVGAILRQFPGYHVLTWNGFTHETEFCW